MGCGASTAAVHGENPNKTKGKGKAGESLRSGHSAYAANELPSHEDDEDFEEPELTEEQQRLLQELEHRSTVSTAVSAEEPSSFTVNMRVSIICVKARIFHGIDGSCENAKEIEDAELRRKTSGDINVSAAATHSRLFGDLKPRQVRKIQEWVQKVYSSNGGDLYEPVPERYFRNPDGLPTFSNSPGSPNLQSKSGGLSGTEYPDTPKLLGRSDDMNSFSGTLLTARTHTGGEKSACDASVSDFSDANATPRPAIPGLIDDEETPRMTNLRSPGLGSPAGLGSTADLERY